jgi:hypothetical protein
MGDSPHLGKRWRQNVQASFLYQDIDINHEVYYVLHGDSGKDFTIDRDTGLIRANNTFDREKINQYKFRVVAIDKGREPLSSTCTVIVNIDDVNDNDPKFDKDIYNARVLENMPVDTNVTIVSLVAFGYVMIG